MIGGLFFGHADPDVFTERAERLALGIAAQASIAMTNAQPVPRAARSEAQLKQVASEREQFLRVRASGAFRGRAPEPHEG